MGNGPVGCRGAVVPLSCGRDTNGRCLESAAVSYPRFIRTNFYENSKKNRDCRHSKVLINILFCRNQSKADMIRDILVGAKADDLFDRDGTTRIWTRETSEDKWRKVSDDSQSLYELGMTERGELLCEFQVKFIFLLEIHCIIILIF